MYELLGQVFLVGANNDGKGTPWQQLLILVIVVVFWALGGIVKARTEKAERKEEQQRSERPRRRPVPKQRPRPELARSRSAKPELIGKKPGVRVSPAQVELERTIPQGLEKLKFKGLAQRVEEPQAETVVDVLPSLENPDDLVSAILYYEILGKPLALREPQGMFSGF